MSFEKYIESLQSRSRSERKTIALIATIVTFVIIVAVLFKIGAFKFIVETKTQKPGFLDSLREEADVIFNDFDEQTNGLSSSTSAMIDSFKEFASSTENSDLFETSTVFHSTTTHELDKEDALAAELAAQEENEQSDQETIEE